MFFNYTQSQNPPPPNFHTIQFEVMIEVKHQISIDEAIYDEMVTTEACHCA